MSKENAGTCARPVVQDSEVTCTQSLQPTSGGGAVMRSVGLEFQVNCRQLLLSADGKFMEKQRLVINHKTTNNTHHSIVSLLISDIRLLITYH